jgi:uncharacterized protein YjbI with pentapeptide repeats
MFSIQTPEQLLGAYRISQRYFLDIEFEHNEDLNGVLLSGTIFKDCCFNVDFRNANLSYCQFIDCNLKATDFSFANLQSASITGCTIESTCFKGALVDKFVFHDNSAYGHSIGQEDFIDIYRFD